MKEYVEIPYIGKILLGRLKLDEQTKSLCEHLRINPFDLAQHPIDLAIGQISHNDAERLVKARKTRLPTLREYLEIYEWADQNHPELYESLNQEGCWMHLHGLVKIISPDNVVIYQNNAKHCLSIPKPQMAAFNIEDTDRETGFPKRFSRNGGFKLSLGAAQKTYCNVASGNTIQIDFSPDEDCDPQLNLTANLGIREILL